MSPVQTQLKQKQRCCNTIQFTGRHLAQAGLLRAPCCPPSCPPDVGGSVMSIRPKQTQRAPSLNFCVWSQNETRLCELLTVIKDSKGAADATSVFNYSNRSENEKLIHNLMKKKKLRGLMYVFESRTLNILESSCQPCHF